MDIAQWSLAELVDDPLIGLVMKSDGVDGRELKLLLEQVARGLPTTWLTDPPERGCRAKFSARFNIS
jgi:hypothetical protein